MKLPSERASFINIPVIILQHILWVIKIRSVIDGRLTLDVNEIGDHTKCDLGKWILGETSIPFREEPFFADLVSEHEILHSFVKEIVAEKNSLSISVLEKKFHELYGKSEKIVEYLTLIYNKNVSKILIAA
jgi:methyl-accepting chemotaxis protein